MAGLFGCFRPRSGSRLAQCGGLLASVVAKKHSAVAIITGLSPTEVIASAVQLDDKGETLSVKPASQTCDGLGVLIYPSLLLTTHTTIPSPEAALNAEINLRYSESSLNILRRRFLPELFFATDARLNITVIACEFVNPEMHPLGLDTSTVDKAAYDVGSKVYVLGHDTNKGSPVKLSVGFGYIISNSSVASVVVRSRDEAWLRGSAGFDLKGNFAFIITDSEPENGAAPLKNTGVTIHVIKSWLEPQWQTTKSNARTPRQAAGPQYTRRATYAGPETGAAIGNYVKDIDEVEATSNQKMSSTSSTILHEKASANWELGTGEERKIAHSRKTNGADQKKQEDKDDERLDAIKHEVMRKVTTIKEGMQAGKVGKSTSFSTKMVEVMSNDQPTSARGEKGSLKGTSSRVTTPRGGREHQELGKEKKAANTRGGGGGLLANGTRGGGGGAPANGRKGSPPRRGKPTLHQAFQQDRRSLQLRLHDIPIKDKP